MLRSFLQLGFFSFFFCPLLCQYVNCSSTMYVHVYSSSKFLSISIQITYKPFIVKVSTCYIDTWPMGIWSSVVILITIWLWPFSSVPVKVQAYCDSFYPEVMRLALNPLISSCILPCPKTAEFLADWESCKPSWYSQTHLSFCICLMFPSRLGKLKSAPIILFPDFG